MAHPLIPLTILGGSDRRASRLPPSGKSQNPLTGCKGVDLLVDGIPLVTFVAERFALAGFGPIYVAGPATAYQGVSGVAEVFDTDGPFGGNIRAGIEGMRSRHPEGPVAITTCDILPDVEEIKNALADYRDHLSLDLWFPLIRTAEDSRSLGESAWKPRYRIPPEPNSDQSGGKGIAILPSHLAIFDPEAMRLPFLYRLLDIGYGSRNRPVLDRRSFLIRKSISGILYRDLMNILSFRLPTLTWDTVVHGGAAALKLSRGRLTQQAIENGIRTIFTRRAHRRTHPDRRVRTPILDAMSLAKDIDTREEATSLGVEAAASLPSSTTSVRNTHTEQQDE